MNIVCHDVGTVTDEAVRASVLRVNGPEYEWISGNGRSTEWMMKYYHADIHHLCGCPFTIPFPPMTRPDLNWPILWILSLPSLCRRYRLAPFFKPLPHYPARYNRLATGGNGNPNFQPLLPLDYSRFTNFDYFYHYHHSCLLGPLSVFTVHTLSLRHHIALAPEIWSVWFVWTVMEHRTYLNEILKAVSVTAFHIVGAFVTSLDPYLSTIHNIGSLLSQIYIEPFRICTVHKKEFVS